MPSSESSRNENLQYKNRHFYYEFMNKCLEEKTKNDINIDLVLLNNNYHEIDNQLSVYDVFTENEIFLIQRVVETETYGADLLSKTNVASVIFNRINHTKSKFGNSVWEIIYSPNQFSYFRTKISETTIKAVENAFLHDTTQGALFFHSGKSKKTFNHAKFLFKDDVGHSFYK